MSKHTSGPWFVTGNMTRYVEARIGGGLIQEVAACGPTDADGGYGQQQEANARLISSAPDLLEALEGMVRKAQKQNWNDNYPAELSAAYAAIAKARGESK